MPHPSFSALTQLQKIQSFNGASSLPFTVSLTASHPQIYSSLLQLKEQSWFTVHSKAIWVGVWLLLCSFVAIYWFVAILFLKRELNWWYLIAYIALISIVYQTLRCTQIHSTSAGVENGTNLKHNFSSFSRLRTIMHCLSTQVLFVSSDKISDWCWVLWHSTK